MNKQKLHIIFWLIFSTILLFSGVGVLLGSVETAAAAGPWYVNAATGSDSNDCLSPGTACETVNEALSKASAGDTIHIAAGTYDEAIAIEQAITLLGAGADQTILTNSNGDVMNITDGNGNSVQFPVTIENVAIQDAAGMGMFTSEATTLQTVIIQNNSERGIYNTGSITITNSSITGNTDVSGAAIINFSIARMTMTDVTVSGNSSSNSIVHVQNSASATLTNVTISGNHDGTALITSGTAVVTATNSTIINNTGNALEDYGNGIYLQNSVIANNETPNCWMDMISLGNNLEDDDTCGLDQGSDIVNTNPQLGMLGNNGGAVQTHVPASSSPLIDAGRNDVCPPLDARGVARPVDGDGNSSALCDIGAVEYSAVGVASVGIDAPASGNINTDITISADVLPQTATPPITYTWTADGQSQVVQTNDNSDSVTFNWNSTGLKTINVIADNGLAQSSDSVQINIQAGTQALTSVTISGATSGVVGKDVTLTANAAPANATQPVTYTWVIDGHSNIVQVDGLSDQITVSWPDDGSYDITVTADNGVNSVQDSHTFTAVSWYVNGSSGDDNNDCESASAPCATIQAALDKADADGTIHIAAGIYDEELSVAQGATLLGAGSGQTKLTNSSGTAVTTDDFNNSTNHAVAMHDLTVTNADQMGIVNGEDLTLNNVIIENNGNGGMGNVGTVLMYNSIIRDNTGGSGVALFNSGKVLLEAVTITGNSGDSSIVHTQGGGQTALTNVTISGNYTGTAVLSTASATVNILNSTIVDNGGSAIANYATITAQNSIIANNGSENCMQTITSLGNNIEDADSCNLNQGGDQVNTNPQLGPLTGNFQQVHVPLTGSPAIDGGDNAACPATDQLGNARPADGDDDGTAVCDIGAVESSGSYQVFLPMIMR